MNPFKCVISPEANSLSYCPIPPIARLQNFVGTIVHIFKVALRLDWIYHAILGPVCLSASCHMMPGFALFKCAAWTCNVLRRHLPIDASFGHDYFSRVALEKIDILL